MSEPTIIQREVERIKARQREKAMKSHKNVSDISAELDEWFDINNLMLVTVALINPEARYEIVLNSTDPINQNPNIVVPEDREQYLSEKDKMKLAWGTKTVRSILQQSPLSDSIVNIASPAPDVETDEQLIDWVSFI